MRTFLGSFCSLLFLSHQMALGLGVRLPDQDPLATARGNAFAATADNPSAIYYNPAGITQLDGHNFRLGGYGIYMNVDFDSDMGGSYDTDNDVQVAPQIYYTYSPESLPLSFGLGTYVPYGLEMEWPSDVPFGAIGQRGSLSYFSINPVVAWEIIPNLSIAAGPTFNYGDAELESSLFELDGDGWDPGFTVGLLWQPHPQHSFGLSYRSATEIEFDGNTSFTGLPMSLSSSTDFDFPQHVIFGYSFRPNEKWNFEFNIDWTDWDSLDTLIVDLNVPPGLLLPPTLAIPFNWESSFFYEFGATRYFEEGWRASFGYIFSESSVPESSFNPVIPDSDRHVFSIGAGRDYENWRWDAAYQFAWGPERDISNGTALVPSAANGDYEFQSHAFTLSVGYAF